MIELIWAYTIIVLKVFGLATFCYLFYWKVIDYAHSVWFYSRQGKDVCALVPGHLPLIGNAIQVLNS